MNGFRLPTPQQDQPESTKPAPPVDPDQLRAFTAGAATHSGDDPMPWEQHDPAAKPKHNVSIRVNDYHLELLRHAAQVADQSQGKLLRELVIPELEKLADPREK